VEIVLVETPRHPRLDGVLFPESLLADHRDGLLRFAREHEVTYVDLGAEAGLRPEDFTDERHLRSPTAMGATTRVLSRVLSEALDRIPDGEGAR
jgi:hypothetical protein